MVRSNSFGIVLLALLAVFATGCHRHQTKVRTANQNNQPNATTSFNPWISAPPPINSPPSSQANMPSPAGVVGPVGPVPTVTHTQRCDLLYNVVENGVNREIHKGRKSGKLLYTLTPSGSYWQDTTNQIYLSEIKKTNVDDDHKTRWMIYSPGRAPGVGIIAIARKKNTELSVFEAKIRCVRCSGRMGTLTFPDTVPTGMTSPAHVVYAPVTSSNWTKLDDGYYADDFGRGEFMLAEGLGWYLVLAPNWTGAGIEEFINDDANFDSAHWDPTPGPTVSF